MPTVLVTAFEPYDRWTQNASWLALVELTRSLPSEPRLVTRRYPVDFQRARERLEKDLDGDFDFAIHLGQAPGSTRVRLEAVGLNVGGSSHGNPDALATLVPDGPLGYRSPLPLPSWANSFGPQAFRRRSPSTPAPICATRFFTYRFIWLNVAG